MGGETKSREQACRGHILSFLHQDRGVGNGMNTYSELGHQFKFRPVLMVTEAVDVLELLEGLVLILSRTTKGLSIMTLTVQGKTAEKTCPTYSILLCTCQM